MKVFRFAPSPSGLVHLGNISGCMLSYALSRSTKGKFILRIEDTDLKRTVENAVDSIIKDFKWLGIDYAEGPELGKKNEFFQSERLDIYKKYIDQLLAEGKAYKAYETPEERQRQIEEQRKSGKLPIYSGGHANLTEEERLKFESEGREPVVRLKVPLGRTIEFEDMVFGHVKVNTNTIGDFVIQRSNGYPMYNMAVVIDDHLMGVTDVLRGFDHLNNTPRQILIYEALGWELPRFGHHSSLLAESEKGKLSKRRGAKPIMQYRAEGYLADAIYNYIVVTFCSFSFKSKDEEVMSREELFDKISVDKILRTNAKFNSQKLDWFNGQHIRKLNPIDFESGVLSWLQNDAKLIQQFRSDFDETVVDSFLQNFDTVKKALPLIHERIARLEDVISQLNFMFNAPLRDQIDVTPTKHPQEEFDKVVKDLYNIITSLKTPWKHEEWESHIRQVADIHGWKHGDMFMALRLLIVGDRYSPPLFEIMEILGQEECLKRINAYTTN